MIVVTHHKAATNWQIHYLEDFCQLNSLSFSRTHLSTLMPATVTDVTLSTNASYDFIKGRHYTGVHIIRNPLDLIVSAYFSHRNTHPLNGWPELARQRQVLQTVDVRDGMFLTLAFLERDNFYDGAVGPLHALRHWDFNDHRFSTLKMEDVVSNRDIFLGSALQREFTGSVLPANDYSFEAIAGRKAGNVDDGSHYRSGKANQWRDILPDAIVKFVRTHFEVIFTKFYPECL